MGKVANHGQKKWFRPSRTRFPSLADRPDKDCCGEGPFPRVDRPNGGMMGLGAGAGRGMGA